MSAPGQLPLRRREFKYYLDSSMVPTIRDHLRGIARRDPFAGADGTYHVRSLYLDTRDLRLYQANDDELGSRFKVRIRCYPDTPSAPAFLEIKRRTGDIISKTRLRVRRERWADGLVPHAPAPTDAAVQRFADLVALHRLQPSVLVEYRREAYQSELEHYARVSIDSQITCQRARRWTLDATDRGWRSVDHAVRTETLGSVAVLELKFADAPPYWMVDLVRRLDLMRFAFSKYCFSVDAQRDLPTRRVVRAR